MKLECTIKRAGGTEVSIPNDDGTETAYHFKPIDPTRADSPHIADVDDEHVAAFLKADSEVYVPFKTSGAKVEALLQKPTSQDDPPPTSPAELPPLTIAELHDAIAAGSLDEETLRAYMAQEESAEEPRSGFIAEIVKALKK